MILIVDCGSQKTPFIEDSINELGDYLTIPLMELNIDSIESCQGIIFSGAPLLITEINMEIYLSKFQWIKELTIPILGICFGHQLVGMLFGAYPSRMREDRDWQEIEVLIDDEILDKLPTSFSMMEDHCESISIPPGFDLLATSDACVNEMMRHQKKLIYGVQFHPEVSGNSGMILFQNFHTICQTHKKTQ
jgi:GMP synthase (glutamine-hydrolysing)